MGTARLLSAPPALLGLRNRVATTDSVSVTNTAVLQSFAAVTLEAWVFPEQWPLISTGRLAQNCDGVSKGIGIFVDTNGQMSAQCGNSTTAPGVTAPVGALLLGHWQHVAASWDGTTLRLFCRGLLVGSTALSGGTTGNPAKDLIFGNNLAAGNRPLGAVLREVRLSNTARYTAAFQPQKAPFAADANTVGLWHLADGSGTSASDSGPNGLTGTITGSQWVRR